MRFEVVKMEDEEPGWKFLISSSDSFGNDWERKAVVCSFGPCSLYGVTCNRMDETAEERPEPKAPKRYSK